jgi:hypothetical protein
VVWSGAARKSGLVERDIAGRPTSRGQSRQPSPPLVLPRVGVVAAAVDGLRSGCRAGVEPAPGHVGREAADRVPVAPARGAEQFAALSRIALTVESHEVGAVTSRPRPEHLKRVAIPRKNSGAMVRHRMWLRPLVLAVLLVLAGGLLSAPVAASHHHDWVGVYNPDCPLVAVATVDRQPGLVVTAAATPLVSATGLVAAVPVDAEAARPSTDVRFRAPPTR